MVDRADERPSWAARILAPLAFLTAATILVLLVQSSLDRDAASPTTTGAPATGADTETETGAATETTATTDTQPAKKRFYRVKAGDTLEAIAARFDTTVVDLLELNPEIDPLALNPGQRIRVR